MKVTLAVVASANGKITDGTSDIYTWTSQEDQALFTELKNKSSLIVMGAKTYEAAKSNLKLSEKTLRVVLTRNPQKYKDDIVKGQLEFTNESPKNLVQRLERVGYSEMLLVSGGDINTLFFKEKLISELKLTMEPILFGEGKYILADTPLKINLTLIDTKKLNTRGTMHLTYAVYYP
jgi:dihydrofolate reductase